MKKKVGKLAFLSLIAFTLCACGNKSSGKGCGGETCRIGDKRYTPKEAIPTEEAVFPE